MYISPANTTKLEREQPTKNGLWLYSVSLTHNTHIRCLPSVNPDTVEAQQKQP